MTKRPSAPRFARAAPNRDVAVPHRHRKVLTAAVAQAAAGISGGVTFDLPPDAESSGCDRRGRARIGMLC
jgi:hypothetical protein